MRIYVSNLPLSLSEKEMEQLFAEYGRVDAVIIESLGGATFGYVDMPVNDQARAAIEALNGREVNGQRITACEASASTVP